MSEQENNIDVEKLTAEQIEEIEASDKFIVEFTEDDYNDPDKVEELRKHMERSKTSIHQKRHFRDKAGRLEKELATKVPGKKENENPPAPKAEDKKSVVEPYQIVTFRQDNPSMSKETVAEISKLAGAFGISMEEAAASETGKAVIKTLENKESNADASIAPSRKTGAGLEKKDWSTASPAEMEAQRNRILTQGGQ